ncbi:MAG: Xaa-Pro peptidase family protein [Clostridia bacterium]|nr:Xaa-Pro peptidase family protein [Clostridia bacterium]
MSLLQKERISRVLEAMARDHVEQLIVSSPSSVFYLTGKWIAPGERMLALYLHANGTVRLFANRLFALTDTLDTPLTEFDDTEDCVAILANYLRPGKVGIDKFWPSQFTIRLMESRSDILPVIGSQYIDSVRLCKDAQELQLMRESSRRNDAATMAAISRIRLGMTEQELAGIHTQEAEARGSSGPSFEPLICFGANAAEPHHATDKHTVLKNGDAVILDVGLTWQDYCSDMTRTVFMGNPTDEQKRVYEIVKAANAAGRAAVHPGVRMKDIDFAARKVIEDAGYGAYFIHRTGHGIGLDVHEYPDVSSVNDLPAKPGMVFSVEPGIYLPGRFGIRVEDLVAVTEDGAETLNAASRELQIL